MKYGGSADMSHIARAGRAFARCRASGIARPSFASCWVSSCAGSATVFRDGAWTPVGSICKESIFRQDTQDTI